MPVPWGHAHPVQHHITPPRECVPGLENRCLSTRSFIPDLKQLKELGKKTRATRQAAYSIEVDLEGLGTYPPKLQ